MEAETLNKQVLARDPRDVEAQVARGRIFFQQGKLEDAVNELRKQTSEAPDYGPAHYYLGLALWRKGDTALAENELKAALEKSPNSTAALHDLAALYLASGDLNDAEDSAKRAVASMPSSADERLLLGSVYLREHNLAQARDVDRRRQNNLVPITRPSTWLSRKLTLPQQKWNDADRELETALNLQPRDTAALGQLANLYAKRGQLDKGIARVRQYLSQFPG